MCCASPSSLFSFSLPPSRSLPPKNIANPTQHSPFVGQSSRLTAPHRQYTDKSTTAPACKVCLPHPSTAEKVRVILAAFMCSLLPINSPDWSSSNKSPLLFSFSSLLSCKIQCGMNNFLHNSYVLAINQIIPRDPSLSLNPSRKIPLHQSGLFCQSVVSAVDPGHNQFPCQPRITIRKRIHIFEHSLLLLEHSLIYIFFF